MRLTQFLSGFCSYLFEKNIKILNLSYCIAEQ